jgi:hypothetical protein
MRKLSTKTHVRLANGHQVASTKVCDVLFTLVQHKIVCKFHVLCNLRAADIALGLLWLDDEQATLKFGIERLFALMNCTVVETQMVDRRPECPLISFA